MAITTEKLEMKSLPCIPLRGIVVFPMIPINVETSEKNIVEICERASQNNTEIVFVTMRELHTEEPAEKDLFRFGTTARIKQLIKLPDGTARLIVDGTSRMEITSFVFGTQGITAMGFIRYLNIDAEGGIHSEALLMNTVSAVEKITGYMQKASKELLMAVRGIKEPGLLADFIASNVLVKYADKQAVLEEPNPVKRLELVNVLLESEEEILRTEQDIHAKVRQQIEQNQRTYYLREQLKVIQNELRGDNPFYDDEEESYYDEESDGDELNEYADRIRHATQGAAPEIRAKLMKELKRLAKVPYGAAEGNVLRNYLDVALEYPWTKKTKDRVDIKAARKILDADHDGMEKVKQRILEYLAVRQINPDAGNQILCLVGPPGVGKTSIAASIARALHRKYVRVSLGGIRDEADIRGHRKTYVGAMPGRIVSAISEAGVNNPLILLDELDKMTRDAHGDPASAMLEVLDGEQNKSFRDHFMELPIDLSDCMFIATANTLETVPTPLLDRIEIIELPSYTREEKHSIAVNHLIGKQCKRHGLNKRVLRISDDAVYDIIDFYTREAGVRRLEREIAALCRKAAMKITDEGVKSCTVTRENLTEYLGKHKVKPEVIFKNNEVGVVNGLAYTESGGDLLKIEVTTVPGTGHIELTGSLGDVMKESARAAITFVRSRTERFGIDPDFYKNCDIHIHVPEGAVPKDGPSAGVTMVTALVSELSGRAVRRDVAMTGEISLRGRVMAIGGLREKTMAAYKAGVKIICIPEENIPDLDEVAPIVKEHVTFYPCAHVDEVLSIALTEEKPSEYSLPHIPQPLPLLTLDPGKQTEIPLAIPGADESDETTGVQASCR
ncbi:MAG: endopeptidase La [Clostridia bacterium]|nr:endopeptidase La [Clostridia bacterium]